MVHIEPIAQSRNTSCDLVELYALLASIWVGLETGGDAMGRADLPRFWTYIAAYCGGKWEKSDLELAAVPERSGRGETSQRLRRDNERGSGWRERGKNNRDRGGMR